MRLSVDEWASEAGSDGVERSILGLRQEGQKAYGGGWFRDADWKFVKSFEPVDKRDLPLYVSWNVSPIFTHLLERL
jgi:hypothetical protein